MPKPGLPGICTKLDSRSCQTKSSVASSRLCDTTIPGTNTSYRRSSPRWRHRRGGVYSAANGERQQQHSASNVVSTGSPQSTPVISTRRIDNGLRKNGPGGIGIMLRGRNRIRHGGLRSSLHRDPIRPEFPRTSPSKRRKERKEKTRVVAKEKQHPARARKAQPMRIQRALHLPRNPFGRINPRIRQMQEPL